jgi:23S rRNA pseudouridine2605 synthase
MLERLQKIISAAGVTSRRAAEELISEGRVRLNGKVVTELGTKADASKDHIKVDGKLINPRQTPTYIMLNKPAGFVTTMSDPEGRPTVQGLLKGVKTRVYPVGRLDYNTEGLLLLTNDGDFAHLITHPKHEFPKTYLAKVKGVLDDRMIELLEKGMFLQDGKTAPAKVRKVRKEEANSWVEITIHEGRKRQVRRMFDHVGRSVIRLKRIRTGSLSLGDLPEGKFRHLTPDEAKGLMETALKTDDRELRPGAAVPAIKRPEQQSQSTEKRDMRPASAGRTVRVKTQGSKKAHRGRMPDLRPWRREEGQGKAPGRATTGGLRSAQKGSFRPGGERRYGPATRSASSRPTTRTFARTSAAVSERKTDVRRKPSPGAWPGKRAGGPGGSAAGRGPRGEGRTQTSGRFNRRTDKGRKGPGRGTKFAGRGPGRKK